VATPILGHRLVAYPGFIPWFLRLGGQMPLISDSDATVYADQFRDRARTAASSQLYRSYWRLAHAILLRRAFEGQRLQAPTQVLFGANDFYIPRGGARGDRGPRGRFDPRSCRGVQPLDARGALTSSPTEQGHCSADSDP
jgi:hypothetical protein